MEKNIIIFTCEDHVEMAIDDMIVKRDDEVAPTVELDNDSVCDYCKNSSKYKIY